MPEPEDGPTVVGPEALKGLAHPLRLRLLEELHDRGRATATQLAEALGESSGATSYHLRQLHRHGLVVEDHTAGTRRERYWRPVPGGWDLPVLDLMDDVTSGQAADMVLREQLLQDTQRALRTVHQARSWPQPWRDAIRGSSSRLNLTAEQVGELHAELDAVLDRYRAMAPRPGSRRVVVQVSTLPTEHPGVGPAEEPTEEATEEAAEEPTEEPTGEATGEATQGPVAGAGPR